MSGRSLAGLVILCLHCGGRTENVVPPDASPEDGSPMPSHARSCSTPHPGADSTCGKHDNEDCCGTYVVPGGSFKRLDDRLRPGVQDLPATVSTFRLDAFEVTVGRFRAFVEAFDSAKPKPGDGASSHVPGSGWQAAWPLAANRADLERALATDECRQDVFRSWTATPGAHELHPMNCITWYELFAFCAWDGGRLPTFAELHYAFSGGSEQRVYPWSVPPEDSTVDGTFALYAGNILMPPPLGPVGARPRGKGRWGHYDLAGNVTEWVMDTSGAYQVPCDDCAQLHHPVEDPPEGRLALGGSFLEDVEALRVYPLNGNEVLVRDSRMGGRCVRE